MGSRPHRAYTRLGATTKPCPDIYLYVTLPPGRMALYGEAGSPYGMARNPTVSLPVNLFTEKKNAREASLGCPRQDGLPTPPRMHPAVGHHQTMPRHVLYVTLPSGCLALCGAAGRPSDTACNPLCTAQGSPTQIPDGLAAATHSAEHPGGRVTWGYMSGHGLAAGHSQVHAWRGWGPIPGRAPGRGSPGWWVMGHTSWPTRRYP